MNIKQYIIDKSKELNIDMVGFTDCEPFEYLKEYLIERKRLSLNTEFEESDIDKRLNPKITFPECKSIISIGISYNNDYDEKVDYRLKGIISKSSWGMDYHIVMRNRMENLIDEIKKVKDFNYQYYVDTGPLIDREIARKSGIGYYGKNCSIINEKFGSFIFLGYILTDLEIDELSTPAESKCGDCDLCLRACPTGALEGAFRVNSKKCISYLTQTKNSIPYDLREKMGSKIYGCDTCQKACPKNNRVLKPNHEEFIPYDAKGYVNIEKLLYMSNREFKEKYGKMAGSWRGKNILRRNAIIALANNKNKDNIKLLLPLLEDPSLMIREYALWAMEKLKG